MSEYRDDTQETAIISDQLVSRIAVLADETVRVADALMFGVSVVHDEAFFAHDELTDNTYYVIYEQAAAHDGAIGKLFSRASTSERVKASDGTQHRISIATEDNISALDVTSGRAVAFLSDGFKVSDAAHATKTVSMVISDSFRAHDDVLQFGRMVIEEPAQVGDEVLIRMAGVRIVADDNIRISDTAIGRMIRSDIAIGNIKVKDGTSGLLQAANSVNEAPIFIDDIIMGAENLTGQVWTANTESWAMSRYDPTTFERLTVINGVLYGESESGIYALTGRDGIIDARIQTGKVDFGEMLAHPVAAYLEYETDGDAEMDVATTQSGNAYSYTYRLASEWAGELTNGRFIFGRGLRGRHFTFTLRMSGGYFGINDLSIDAVQTRRRV